MSIVSQLKKTFRPLVGGGMLRFYHKSQAIAANIVYGFPARRLRIIGVTGTKGKTTTSFMIGAIMQAAGYKTAVATTVAFQVGEDRETNELNMTTPSPWVIQKFLAKAVKQGAHVAVVETTSHALDQERVWGLKYDTVVFTNLSHDHLDYHKTVEAYREAKLRLFEKRPRIAVVNADDPAGSFFLAKEAVHQYTYGVDAKADVTARKVMLEPTGSLFTAVTPAGQVAIDLKLPGKFNISNALAALTVGLSHGIGLETIKQAIESVALVPGRMERVDVGQDFTVLIDYAHTPDSFEKVYETLRPVVSGRIIHVFGCTGDRDKTKRPIMGALAARSADLVVVTTDEPYTEDPNRIIAEIVEGVKRGRPKAKVDDERTDHDGGENVWWWRIPDRRQAIAQALSLAKKGDVVLITGMGDERWMTIADGQGGITRVAWNERRIIKDLLVQQLHQTGGVVKADIEEANA